MAITTVVFDAYGTLFDVTAAARVAASEPNYPQLAKCWEKLAADWRSKQLEYTWLRAVTGEHCDFWQVTGDGLDWALEAQNLTDTALRDRLMQLYRELLAYPEVPEMLRTLKEQGYATAILSNGSPDMLKAAVDSAGIGDHLDAVLSVESVGVFKPNSQVYDLVGQEFGCPRGKVLFVSSNGWDAACATSYGFRTMWVNRAGLPVDRMPRKPDVIRPDLSTVPTVARQMLNDLQTSAAEIGETKYFQNPEGLRLAYRDDGLRDGPILLCLAGLTRNMADFDFIARDFGHRARILRLDTRGRGQSDWDADYLNYNLIRESRDALALLDHLGIEKAAILGTSRGGLIAMSIAAGHKERLTGVCLNDIGPEIEPEGLAYIAGHLGIRPLQKNYEGAADSLVARTAAMFPGVSRDRWLLHSRRIFTETPEGLDLRYDALLRNSIMEQSATDAIPDVWLLFDALKGFPVALIRGANSDILSAKTAAEMCRRNPDMLFGEVPDRGHVPFLDEPVSQDIISKFLDALPGE